MLSRAREGLSRSVVAQGAVPELPQQLPEGEGEGAHAAASTSAEQR